MKPRPFDYVRPDTLEEAVAILAEHGDDARILAGGQTLLAMLNLRVVEPVILVDITRIPELDVIREIDTQGQGGKIEVGAAVTQNRLMAWPALAQKLPLLAAALPFVGHFQTRNKGTVCGSVAHADPTSEIPLSLAVLEGEVVLIEEDGETVLKPGDAAGFKAGSGNGHCLVNRGSRDALYLEVGTRAASERVHYPDVDLRMERDGSGRRFVTRAGEVIAD